VAEGQTEFLSVAKNEGPSRPASPKA